MGDLPEEPPVSPDDKWFVLLRDTLIYRLDHPLASDLRVDYMDMLVLTLVVWTTVILRWFDREDPLLREEFKKCLQHCRAKGWFHFPPPDSSLVHCFHLCYGMPKVTPDISVHSLHYWRSRTIKMH